MYAVRRATRRASRRPPPVRHGPDRRTSIVVSTETTSASPVRCPARIESILASTLPRRSAGVSSQPQERLISALIACSSPYCFRQGEHSSKCTRSLSQSPSAISLSRNS
ncbi:hypothetical protein VR45_08785 [Streptomyces sp. NRRL S-495]|nr:hypothetical protein VR45_08785 [Streptomyces sp. NRRL S-495]